MTEHLRPLERFKIDLDKADFQYDAAQAMAVKKLDNLYARLIARQALVPGLRARVGNWLSVLMGCPRKIMPEQGLYFWGGVGRGKTYLMDMFYDSVRRCEITHSFSSLYASCASRLTDLDGVKNPLERVADKIAAEASLICFDEFFVSDITDAMILAGMFEALFDRGVCLVATSNIAPDELYKDGLQRADFYLPLL